VGEEISIHGLENYLVHLDDNHKEQLHLCHDTKDLKAEIPGKIITTQPNQTTACLPPSPQKSQSKSIISYQSYHKKEDHSISLGNHMKVVLISHDCHNQILSSCSAQSGNHWNMEEVAEPPFETSFDVPREQKKTDWMAHGEVVVSSNLYYA